MTWKGIRNTLRWMVLLAMLGVIAAGGFAARWWAAKDALVADLIRTRLQEALPECLVDFETTRFVDTGHLELTHLLIRSRATQQELLRVPRIVFSIQTEILRDYRRLAIRDITLQSPEVTLLKGTDQRWNWEEVRLVVPASASSPSWVVKNGTVRIGCSSPADGQIRTIQLQGIHLGLHPESFKRYAIEAVSMSDALGPIQVSGVLDSNTGEWKLRGVAGEVHLSDSLLELAGRFSPRVQEQLIQIQKSNRELLAQSQQNLVQAQIIASEPVPPSRSQDQLGASLVRADVAIQFELGQTEKGARLYYDVNGSVDHGHISEQLLPIPLYDLQGRFRFTPDRLEIRGMKAANGASTLLVDGAATRKVNGWSNSFQVRATQLHFDKRVRGFLWGQLAKVFDLLNPSGTFDVDINLAQEPGQRMSYAINTFKVIDCRGVCDEFRYPVEQVNGSVRQEGSAFVLEMSGVANGRPIQLDGRIDLTNRDRDIDLKIYLTDFPYDQNIRAALQKPEQQTIATILDSLSLTGTIRTGTVNIVRGGVTGGKVMVCLSGELQDGAMKYALFPYEITNLSGKLNFNPLQRNTWMFTDVQGQHGETKVTGQGFFDLENGPGELALEMTVLQAPLDQDLEKASITASPELATVWSDFHIRGAVDIDKVAVHWTEEEGCDVRLEGIHWNHGHFQAKALPYQWNNVSGTLTWKDKRLTIHSLHGDHDGTYLLIDGSIPDSAFIEIEPGPGVAWRMYMDERILHIIKLKPDDELRRAVPPVVADVLKAVNLQGTVDLSIGMELKGWVSDRNLITASWSTLAALKENTLFAGVQLNDVTGNIVHRGSWDGKNLWMEGYCELDKLNALELSFRKARGPFQLKDGRLTLGTPRLSGNPPAHHRGNPYHQEQLRADMYSGQIGLDVDITTAMSIANMLYQIEINVNNAELGEWAQEHGFNSEKLMGKVNAVLQASGKGASTQYTTGQGWVQITPAALLEAPVFAQIFNVLSFRPTRPNDAMFKYAYGDFTIHDNVFDFSKIELWGDAISLVGQGTVGFAGDRYSALNLDFYSMANNRVPFFGPLVKAVSDRWIRVQVFGTTSQPIARIQNRIPYLNDAFAGFMQALESGQTQRSPPRPVTR
jgi:hypothetical protein